MNKTSFIQQLTLQYLATNQKYKDASPESYYNEYKKVFDYFSQRMGEDDSVTNFGAQSF
ncbi:MAG: hypothetical protein HFG70_04915 [Hungatella sp.]|jgi:hypothetical protein|nr:hypothetical protein [Hungatella sp.]